MWRKKLQRSLGADNSEARNNGGQNGGAGASKLRWPLAIVSLEIKCRENVDMVIRRPDLSPEWAAAYAMAHLHICMSLPARLLETGREVLGDAMIDLRPQQATW